MKSIFIIMLLFLNFSKIKAQDLTIPEKILNEIQSKTFINLNQELDTLTFHIIYPKNYNPKKEYPILLGLSGGSQSKEIVNYCYAAWFKSDYFKNYISILPVNTKKKNLKDYTPNNIKELTTTIKNNFKTKKDHWIIVGTSNGGVAIFNFVAVEPNLYEGVIAIPGYINKQVTIEPNWKHLKVVLAYGELDTVDWFNATENASEKLKEKVQSVTTYKMKGQEHLLKIGYNIDNVYDLYFKKQEKQTKK